MSTDSNENAHLAGLTGPQTVALLELLTGSNVTDAAKAADVTRSTVSRWVNKPGPFQTALHALRREPLEHARRGLQSLSVKAMLALSGVLTASDTPAGAKVSAASQVLRAAGIGSPETQVDVQQSTSVGVAVDVDQTDERIEQAIETLGDRELAKLIAHLEDPDQVDVDKLIDEYLALPKPALRPLERLCAALVKAGRMKAPPAPSKRKGRK